MVLENRKRREPVNAKGLLACEEGTWLKKWKGRLPVALIYPNKYAIGVSSLGFQLVYSLLNAFDQLVCERFFLPERGESLRSFETAHPLHDFPLILYSISFEHDYLNLVRILLTGNVPLFASKRGDACISSDNPLVIGGGVATFMNPEPLAPFTDLYLLGEAEGIVEPLVSFLDNFLGSKKRNELLLAAQQELAGAYVPAFYQPIYEQDNGKQSGVKHLVTAPKRIEKVIVNASVTAAHSQLLSPRAEFAHLYVTELGRGCSRGCRFCAAGFIYRPPRLWSAEAVIRGLEERSQSVKRIGLLGMEMAHEQELEQISSYLLASGCSLSFSSLRADRISGTLLELLSKSGLKSVAIAPDGASERLRRVINKNLSEEDILLASERLVDAGIFKLKLYLMVGLPGETNEDLLEMVELVKKVKEKMLPVGKRRGRLCQIVLSINTFVPKPWTPFQFYPFGGELQDTDTMGSVQKSVKLLKRKIAFIKKELKNVANVHVKHDNPDNVLFQAVLSRGDRRLAKVLVDMAAEKISWKQSMRRYGLSAEQFVLVAHSAEDYFPWNIVDHGIEQHYLWREYKKSIQGKTSVACDTAVCKRCGVCGD